MASTTIRKPSRKRSSVSFGTVTVREYERKLDKELDADLGLSLGWGFVEWEPVDLNCIQQRKGHAIPIDELQRKKILLEMGYTKEELRAALEERYAILKGSRIAKEVFRTVFSTPVKLIKKKTSSKRKGKGNERRFTFPALEKELPDIDDGVIYNVAGATSIDHPQPVTVHRSSSDPIISS